MVCLRAETELMCSCVGVDMIDGIVDVVFVDGLLSGTDVVMLKAVRLLRSSRSGVEK